jgi:hypothetical protein
MQDTKGPKLVNKDDLIWVQEAAKAYGRSTIWIQSRIKEGIIRAYKIYGDRKQYVLRSDIEALLAPRPWTEEDSEVVN